MEPPAAIVDRQRPPGTAVHVAAAPERGTPRAADRV